MGMYDTLVISKRLLPLTDEEKTKLPEQPGWQTKDLDCILANVYITEEGELKIDRTSSDFIDLLTDSSLPDGTHSIDDRLDIIDHHGYVRFYSSIEGVWFEFRAKFTDGKLIAIERT